MIVCLFMSKACNPLDYFQQYKWKFLSKHHKTGVNIQHLCVIIISEKNDISRQNCNYFNYNKQVERQCLSLQFYCKLCRAWLGSMLNLRISQWSQILVQSLNNFNRFVQEILFLVKNTKQKFGSNAHKCADFSNFENLNSIHLQVTTKPPTHQGWRYRMQVIDEQKIY